MRRDHFQFSMLSYYFRLGWDAVSFSKRPTNVRRDWHQILMTWTLTTFHRRKNKRRLVVWPVAPAKWTGKHIRSPKLDETITILERPAVWKEVETIENRKRPQWRWWLSDRNWRGYWQCRPLCTYIVGMDSHYHKKKERKTNVTCSVTGHLASVAVDSWRHHDAI